MVNIFVYGSLREGLYNYDRYLKGKGRKLGTGYVKGLMYAIKGAAYPALLPGDEYIFGELYEVSDEVAQALDELEAYFAPNHPDNEYDKILSDIYNEKREVMTQLHVYFFNMRNEKHIHSLSHVITCHDFVRYCNMNNQ